MNNVKSAVFSLYPGLASPFSCRCVKPVVAYMRLKAYGPKTFIPNVLEEIGNSIKNLSFVFR